MKLKDNKPIKMTHDEAVIMFGELIEIKSEEDYYLFEEGFLQDSMGYVILESLPTTYYRELLEKRTTI